MKKDKRKLSIPPKKDGFQGLTWVCSYCGKYYSDASGHTCGEDDYY
ncbi:hypothetical protein LCGC14_0556680 [marine sediment metagenome]|uniref:Uncharacterized protein n=1 Tax=marine sediment metagenome TaxID=412755 RepID=A0A0F9RN85_9ZZZZ